MLIVRMYSVDGASKLISSVHCEAGAIVGSGTSPWECSMLPSCEVITHCKEYPRRVYTGISESIGPRLCIVTVNIDRPLLPCKMFNESNSTGENSSRRTSHDGRLFRSGLTIPMTKFERVR